MRHVGATTAAIVALGVLMPVAADQASIANARTEARSAARGLDAAVRQVIDSGATAWVGYQVPILRSRDASPSSTGRCCGQCRLAPATDLLVLARVAGKALVELRTSAVDCDVDAGGMTVIWLNDVRADDSVAWLSSLAAGQVPGAVRMDKVARTALTGLALHDAPAAAASLVALARGASPDVRGQALFWLAQRASDQAAAAIADAIERDPDVAVRKQAVFALSNLPKEQSVPLLIELARTNKNTDVRRQAMFWLGQKDDPRVLAFFEQILLK